MKKDKLEKFITDNRERFDQDIPDEKVWKHISGRLANVPSSTTRLTWIWKAAAILFMGTTAFLTYQINKTQRATLVTVQEQPAQIPKSPVQEFNQIETYYLEQIQLKREMVLQIANTDFLPDPSIDLDLHRMDAMYQVLKEEYERNPTDGVREALMLNLLIRTDLLNDELAKIEKSKEVMG